METDSSTEKTTQYCTECKTTSKGEDLGCTHSQTDVGLTINGGILGIKPIGPEVSTDKLSDDSKDQVPNDFDIKDDGLLTKNDDDKTSNSLSSEPQKEPGKLEIPNLRIPGPNLSSEK